MPIETRTPEGTRVTVSIRCKTCGSDWVEQPGPCPLKREPTGHLHAGCQYCGGGACIRITDASVADALHSHPREAPCTPSCRRRTPPEPS